MDYAGVPQSSESRAREIADRLVAWPSVTGTAGEAAFADHARGLLLEIPYFAAHPEDVALIDSHGTPPARNVAALVRGRGRRCVVLAGHYDTVSITDYGALSPCALQPDALATALAADLRAHPRNAHEELALADLDSGAYRPGRGMLDMKSGDAAGIVALERFAQERYREGNLLLLLTPDEENRSRGMRSMRDALPDLARRWGLDIVAGINLDSVSDLGDGDDGRAVHVGTVGKQMPFAYVVGRPTHAGYPYDGVSASLIGAEIIRAVEARPELCDEAFGELAPPPVCLEARDLRAGYNVTTPAAFWLAFNWLTHARGPDAVLGQFRGIVAAAMQAALDRLAAGARAFDRRTGGVHVPHPPGALWSFADLKARAFEQGGDEAIARHEALLTALRHEENPLAASRALVADLVASARVEGPAVVTGFASLHYPATHAGAEHAAVLAAIEAAVAGVAAAHGTSVRRREYFAGICDMSFLGVRPDPGQAAFVAANTPSPDAIDMAPADALCFPVVNIGPWGREYHQRTERVHAAYAFAVLPDLLTAAAGAVLRLPQGGPR